MNRRILLLVTDLEIGGTPTVVRELACRLNQPGEVDVHVACLGRFGPVARQIAESGIAVTALGAASSRDMRVFGRLLRLCRNKKFDTVFSFLVHANAAAAAVKPFLPGVLWIQSIQTSQPNPAWHWWLQGIIGRFADRIMVPSASVARVAREWSHLPDEKIVVIPNAVDVRQFIPGRENVGTNIVFLGRLDPIKRVDDLLRAVAILPSPYRLDIHGDGRERAALENLSRSLAILDRVTFHGATIAPAKALEQADVFVLCSDAEGFGLVLIEAMNAGVPVIGTNAPGIRDVIEGGVSGILVAPRSPAALAAAVKQVCQSSELRSKLIQGGITRVREKFSWANVIFQYRQLLQLVPAER